MRRFVIAVLTVVGAVLASTGPATPAFAAPPANDDFADAVTISGNQGGRSVPMGDATREPGEPLHPDTYGTPTGAPSVWFRWTAPADGWYRFSVNHPDSSRDGCMGTTHLYQGTAVESLELVSHAAAVTGPHWIEDTPESTFIRANAGEAYSVVVAADCSSSMSFSWERSAPLIVRVQHPDGRYLAGERVGAGLPGPDDLRYGRTSDATGRVYFPVTTWDTEWSIGVAPRSPNLDSFSRTITLPPESDNALTYTAKLRPAATLDLDHDGTNDVVSGAPYANRGAGDSGAVVVHFGNGRRRVIDQRSAGVPSDPLRGEQFGNAIFSQDVNRDGWIDLTIGAPGEMVGTLRSGAVYVVFGSPKGIGNGATSLRIHQSSPGIEGSRAAGDRFGAAVAVNYARGAHFLVGIPGKDVGGVENAGAIVRFTRFTELQQTAASLVWHQDTPGVGDANEAGDRFGSALVVGAFDSTAAGDINGPYPSLVIGVPGEDVDGTADAGAIVLLRGSNRNGGFETGYNVMVDQGHPAVPGNGPTARAGFGAVLAGAALGHWRTYTDYLLVGAPGDGGGSMSILAPTASSTAFSASANNAHMRQGVNGVPGTDEVGDRFGGALAVGDLDDNGNFDIVVGAPGEEVAGRASAGASTILYGVTQAAGAAFKLDRTTSLRPGAAGLPGGPSAGVRFGQSVSTGDVTGDGWPEVLAGAPGDDTVARNAGALFAATGGASGLSGGRRLLWPDASAGDGLGATTAVRP